jgi:hypothetical protein
MKLYIGLGVLGLVLLVTAILILSLSSNRPFILPESPPIIVEQLDYVLGTGRSDRLYIYEDGNIIFMQDINTRPPTPRPPTPPAPPGTRIWRIGQLVDGELEQIIGLFKLAEFAAIDDIFRIAGKPPGNIMLTVSINHQGLNKSVNAPIYLNQDGSENYSDMPYPLNDIYVLLKNVVSDRTVEVARERIE